MKSTPYSRSLWPCITLFLLAFHHSIDARAANLSLGGQVGVPGDSDSQFTDIEVAGGVLSGSVHLQASGTASPVVGADGETRLDASFSASSDIFARYERGTLELGFRSHAEGQGGGTSSGHDAHSSGGVNFSDTFTLTGEDSGVISQFDSIIMNWKLSGQSSGSLASGSGSPFEVRSANITFSLEGEHVFYYSDGVNGEYGSIAPSISTSLDLISGQGFYSVSVQYTQAVNWGFMDLFFDETFELDSMMFPDGSTPESHGLTIEFESGIASPNLRIRGDFEEDDDVDGHDFLAWQRDQEVGELADWQSDYGSTVPLSPSFAVPEPNSCLLGCLAFVSICAYTRQEH